MKYLKLNRYFKEYSIFIDIEKQKKSTQKQPFRKNETEWQKGKFN